MLDLLTESRNLENPENPLVIEDEFLSSPSGESVTESTAVRLSAVYACIGVLGRSLGQLPLHVMRRTGNSVERATDHPLYYLLHDEPNSWQTSYDWRETLMVHCNGWGDAYSRIERNRRTGEVLKLHSHAPWEAGLTKVASGRYVYTVSDEDFYGASVHPDDMLHFKAIGSQSKRGTSPIRQCAETFAMGQAVQRYGNKFFGGGGRPTGLVSVKGGLQSSSWDRLVKLWKQAKVKLRSEDNSTLLLPTELDYRSITIAPEDAQFLETRKFNRSEIAGIFNVPAHMINDLEKATFSNISEQAIQFVRHTMVPWVVKFEQELNRKLFTTAERSAGYYIKFNLNGLLRGTAKERAEFYSKGIRDGWLNRNEVRGMEEMNAADGLDEFILSADLQQKEPAETKSNRSTEHEQ